MGGVLFHDPLCDGKTENALQEPHNALGSCRATCDDGAPPDAGLDVGSRLSGLHITEKLGNVMRFQVPNDAGAKERNDVVGDPALVDGQRGVALRLPALTDDVTRFSLLQVIGAERSDGARRAVFASLLSRI